MTPATEMTSRARINGGSTSQTATRLLVALDWLGTPVPADGPVPDAVKVLRSLTRLEKVDFWLRNPDYLADELLTELEEGRQPADVVLPLVTSMLGARAPSLRRYPMAKYLYGAYERPDNALALLKAYGHIDHRRIESGAHARRDYFLLRRGADSLARMRADVSAVGWYDQQAQAITLIPDANQGASARRRQYEQPEYSAALLGDEIPTITTRVQARLESLTAEADRSGDSPATGGPEVAVPGGG